MDLRPTSWLKAAQREFEKFPAEVRIDAETALAIAARGGKADTAKPFMGVDGGVFEIALKHRGNAYRVIYAVQLGDAVRFLLDNPVERRRLGDAARESVLDSFSVEAYAERLAEHLAELAEPDRVAA